jgi:hypothetical protein
VEVRLANGQSVEERQAHLRGGAREPLSAQDLEEKFRANGAYGGWDEARAQRWLAFVRSLGGNPIDLSSFRG